MSKYTERMICPVCGKEFFRALGSRRIYCCKKCAMMAQRKQQYERNRKYRAEDKAIKAATKTDARKGTAKPKTKKPLTLEQINTAALKEGLSYGQYVSKYGL